MSQWLFQPKLRADYYAPFELLAMTLNLDDFINLDDNSELGRLLDDFKPLVSLVSQHASQTTWTV